MDILVAEDDYINARLLSRILAKEGHSVVVASDGVQALKKFKEQRFTALVTDWMMPNMDGIELIRNVRGSAAPVPLIVMVTANDLPEARKYALESGADVFIGKPFSAKEVLDALNTGLARQTQPAPPIDRRPKPSAVAPPFVGVAVAASTGGPASLIELFSNLSGSIRLKAALFVVQHAPEWMLDSFVSRLDKHSSLAIKLGEEGVAVEPGTIYLAPGDKHLVVKQSNMRLHLSDGPPENYVRPAADPLFRSVAAAFGRYSIGVVMTGMGRDGTKGAAEIDAAGGVLLIQDPSTAMAPSMPRTLEEVGLKPQSAPVSRLSSLIVQETERLSTELSKNGRVRRNAGIR